MTMKEENIFGKMPEHYLLCYNTSCKLAENCLHRLGAVYGNPKDVIVKAVNPKNYNGVSCKYYRPKKTVKMAYGMLHCYDKVLSKDIANLRSDIIQHFGNGSYYERRNGNHPITPEEQQFICKQFQKYGYPEGTVFDQYVDEIDW